MYIHEEKKKEPPTLLKRTYCTNMKQDSDHFTKSECFSYLMLFNSERALDLQHLFLFSQTHEQTNKHTHMHAYMDTYMLPRRTILPHAYTHASSVNRAETRNGSLRCVRCVF